ncbi:hypothetical protein CKO27_19110 [Thiocystis violacea]|nr:hypothetical protein [Thiocystis violacea]
MAGASAWLSRPSGLWVLALSLCWWPNPSPVAAEACREAPVMLVHPAVTPPYDRVIEQLAEGVAQGVSQPIGVCALDALSARSWSSPPRQVVAVGAAAYTAAEAAFPGARIRPVLVATLPAPARDGLSAYVDPALVLAPLRALSPGTEALYFIHRRDGPGELVQRAQRAAEQLGLRWIPIAVGGLREAALAIERVRGEASTASAVWFHRDVLALHPDILIPPIVKRSWEVGFPVISDDADTVERGLLFALTPDYRAIGYAAAGRLADERPGLHDIRWVRRVLNARTARAIGLAVRPGVEASFDAVYE